MPTHQRDGVGAKARVKGDAPRTTNIGRHTRARNNVQNARSNETEEQGGERSVFMDDQSRERVRCVGKFN